MPAGDAQRVWFPEMLKVLTAEWSPSTTWDDLIDLCRRVTVQRTEIRRSRGIQAPKWKCPRCGITSGSDIEGVSVRSALFALRKVGAISDADFKKLERDWGKQRDGRGLDPLGNVKRVRLSAERRCCGEVGEPCPSHGDRRMRGGRVEK